MRSASAYRIRWRRRARRPRGPPPGRDDTSPPAGARAARRSCSTGPLDCRRRSRRRRCPPCDPRGPRARRGDGPSPRSRPAADRRRTPRGGWPRASGRPWPHGRRTGPARSRPWSGVAAATASPEAMACSTARSRSPSCAYQRDACACSVCIVPGASRSSSPSRNSRSRLWYRNVVPVAPTSWTRRLRRARARSRLPLPSVPASAFAACGVTVSRIAVRAEQVDLVRRQPGLDLGCQVCGQEAVRAGDLGGAVRAGGANVRERREVRRRRPALGPRGEPLQLLACQPGAGRRDQRRRLARVQGEVRLARRPAPGGRPASGRAAWPAPRGPRSRRGSPPGGGPGSRSGRRGWSGSRSGGRRRAPAPPGDAIDAAGRAGAAPPGGRDARPSADGVVPAVVASRWIRPNAASR